MGEELTPLEILAVSKALKEAAVKAASAEVPEGTYQVDLTVRLVGTVAKGAPTMRTPTASIPLLPAMALLLRRSGVTAASSMDALIGAIEEAMVLGEDARNALLAEVGVADAEQRIRERLAALPKVPVSGAVKTALMIEKV